MAQAVSHGPVTAEALFQSRVVLVGFVVESMTLDRFSQMLAFSPISVTSPLFHIHILFIYHRHYGILAVANVVKKYPRKQCV